jgi:hypothetical protein
MLYSVKWLSKVRTVKMKKFKILFCISSNEIVVLMGNRTDDSKIFFIQ